MSYIRGEDRGQMALLPAAIEDYVAEDAPVRVIDAFVDGLDVRGLGIGRDHLTGNQIFPDAEML
jgi:transposase